MRSLDDTIGRLAAFRKLRSFPVHSPGPDRLKDLTGFGSNPGELRARIHIPASLAANPPLVVVLHGCTQNAAGYDHGSGWSALADRHGFALLFPEQQRSNNPNLCFNWFEPHDTRRGSGEALSIRHMIDAMIRLHGIDPARVFVTGLSAGGAMAATMLAAYPDVFAGGAIIAGLPHGSAASIPEAFDRMRGHGVPESVLLVARAREASAHEGPWPILSVWHGSGDATVNPSNAEAVLAQWRGLHAIGDRPHRIDTVDGYPRRVWTDSAGREVIEHYSITGMGHGTPLDTLGDDALGASGPFMLEASISSTRHIARFWGLTAPETTQRRTAPPKRLAPAPRAPLAAEPPVPAPPPAPAVDPRAFPSLPLAAGRVGKVIEDALRAAGLMR